MDKNFYVYIVTDDLNSVLYIGMAGNLSKRISEHKQGIYEQETLKNYHLHKLIYIELFSDTWAAKARMRMLRKWKREWLNELIKRINPGFVDLLSSTSLLFTNSLRKQGSSIA